MAQIPLFTRFRYWLGLGVLLPILHFVIGERPMFCDFANDCPMGQEGADNV